MVNLEITYCQPCGHQPKAMELVNQLLSTYGMPLNKKMNLTLHPADQGVFDVAVDGKVVFSRKQVGRFPTFEDIKRFVDPQLNMQIEAPPTA